MLIKFAKSDSLEQYKNGAGLEFNDGDIKHVDDETGKYLGETFPGNFQEGEPNTGNTSDDVETDNKQVDATQEETVTETTEEQVQETTQEETTEQADQAQEETQETTQEETQTIASATTDLESLGYNALRKMAIEMGISIPIGTKKEAIKELIKAKMNQ